ncbi:glutathione hydrolase 1 proenzyme-like [Glandiceps talaboti]
MVYGRRDECEDCDLVNETYLYEIYDHGAVTADSAQCAEVGNDMLKRNGTAVDAAIATLLCNGVVNPQSMGIGGGHFMVMYHYKSKSVEVIDAREEAPAEATVDMYEGDPDASFAGGLAIAVPGEIEGYWTEYQRWGRLKWAELFEPSIKLAEEGFPVGESLARAIKQYEDTILNDQQLSDYFAPYGTILEEGDTCTMPALGKTLRRIAEEGGLDYYMGQLAKDIANDIQERGGIITTEDLRGYRAKRKQPLQINVRNLTMYSPSPPSSGAVISFILNILEGYNFTRDDFETEEEAILTYHRITEAFKYAFAYRTELGDEDYVDIEQLVEDMTSDEYAEGIRLLINDSTTYSDVDHYGAVFLTDGSNAGTSHISVVDKFGNAVSVTSTVNTYFGSKVVGERTGIIFNNEMDDFSSPNITNHFGVPPSPANLIEPGKRPLSSMNPVIFLNETQDAVLTIGGAGGTKITTATALSSMNILWFGDNVGEGILRPRIHHQLVPNEVGYEYEFNETILEGLREKNHNTSVYARTASVVQGIHRVQDKIHAYCDDRKDGVPAGH